MTAQVTGRANARSSESAGQLKTFPDTAASDAPQEQVLDIKEQRREMRVKFGSNTVGGDYQMGQIIAHIGEADGRRLA
jgi:hypothetical protein